MSAREINISTIDLAGGEGGGEPAKLQSKSVVLTENKTETIVPDSGFDGLSDVSIETNIHPTEKLIDTLTTNGTHYYGGEYNEAEITVNVPTQDGIDMSKGIFFSYSTFTTEQFESLNTYNWDKITNCAMMFLSCSNITVVPELNIINAANIVRMFGNCTKLTSVLGLNTSKVTNMSDAFSSCTSLTLISLSDTSKVTSMSNAFSSCTSLTAIPQWNTSKVTNMNDTFRLCKNLISIPQLDTSNVTSMGSTFYGCSSLTDLGGFLNLSVNLNLSSCPNLTVDSLMNVINNLKDLTGSTSRTLTLDKTNLAKLSDDQKVVATDKNWVLA